MTPIEFVGQLVGQLSMGIVMAGATIGSALGIGAVGRAATGVWAKEAKAEKPLSFSYIILIGMPLSQTIYGLILMLVGLAPFATGDNPVTVHHAGTLLGIGFAGGLAELFSGWMQGLIGAGACRALSEGKGKGLVFMIIAMGIAETVGLFGFVFLLLILP